MLVKNLITDGIVPLQIDDTGRVALEWMEDLRISHLPIVDNKKLIGLISEFDIYNFDNLDEKIEKMPLTSNAPFVYDYQHVFDALGVLNENKLSLVPVLDEHDNYLGIISLQSIIEFFGDSYSVKEPGGVIVLEMSSNDYSLSEIAQIVESNDAKILSLIINSDPDSTRLQISMKVNKMDLGAILQTFNRYNYNIIASFYDKNNFDDMRNRYDAFMNYLNI